MLRGHVAERLKVADSTFEQLLETVPDAIIGVIGTGEIVLVNGQAEELFGYESADLLGKPLETLVPERFHNVHPSHRNGYFAAPRKRPMGAGVELFGVRKDGSEFPAEISLSSIETEDGMLAMAAVRDITDRAESERERALMEQLNQARRLESVGQLAGGIAHDFNNILGVILNYAEFVADDLETGSQAHQDVEEIRRAAERAARLTRQLLIFSRREVVKPETLNLNVVIGEIENLLVRALGERIELVTRFQEGLRPVEADPGQIEQVLVNLAVNARDAMPDGGRLSIEVENAELDQEFASTHPGIEPGSFVRLKVSDTGVGMDKDVLDRAFEPFFTTKPKGEGTGLGLATVYGIVTQTGGQIDIYSEPPIGTTVKIHLPATDRSADSVSAPDDVTPAGHGEVILVVEDETEVRHTTERILAKGGYSVIGTADAEEALKICEEADRRIDLLLTDVIMPGTLGPALVEKVRAMRPELRVIFMSGYSHDVLAPQALGVQDRAAFIEKPFNSRQLLAAVHEQLQAAEAASDA
jgi:PAS domain S-box-containing protein